MALRVEGDNVCRIVDDVEGAGGDGEEAELVIAGAGGDDVGPRVDGDGADQIVVEDLSVDVAGGDLGVK